MSSKNPVVHFEMPYDDAKRVAEFYSKAFGWQMNNLGDEMMNYITAYTTETGEDRMVKTPGAINGGFFPVADATAKVTSVVISVDDLDAAMQDVKDAGGTIVSEPSEIPGIGMWAVFTDTEGNRVSMLQPKR